MVRNLVAGTLQSMGVNCVDIGMAATPTTNKTIDAPVSFRPNLSCPNKAKVDSIALNERLSTVNIKIISKIVLAFKTTPNTSNLETVPLVKVSGIFLIATNKFMIANVNATRVGKTYPLPPKYWPMT